MIDEEDFIVLDSNEGYDKFRIEVQNLQLIGYVVSNSGCHPVKFFEGIRLLHWVHMIKYRGEVLD